MLIPGFPYRRWTLPFENLLVRLDVVQSGFVNTRPRSLAMRASLF